MRKDGETRSNGHRVDTGYALNVGPEPRSGGQMNTVSAKLRIMLLDDCVYSREALAFVIERQPDMMVAAQAGTLEEARNVLSGIKPSLDVIVLEPELPDGEGEDLLRHLRTAGCEARVLVLSPRPESAVVARTVLAGAQAIMPGSSSLNDVVEAVRRLGRGAMLLSCAEFHGFSRAVARQRQERDERAKLRRLTNREKEILDALTRGLSDKQISEELHITEGTVRQHVARLISKLEVSSRLKAAVIALRNRIV